MLAGSESQGWVARIPFSAHPFQTLIKANVLLGKFSSSETVSLQLKTSWVQFLF